MLQFIKLNYLNSHFPNFQLSKFGQMANSPNVQSVYFVPVSVALCDTHNLIYLCRKIKKTIRYHKSKQCQGASGLIHAEQELLVELKQTKHKLNELRPTKIQGKIDVLGIIIGSNNSHTNPYNRLIRHLGDLTQ